MGPSNVAASASQDALASGIGELLHTADATVRELLATCPPGDPAGRRLEEVCQIMQRLSNLAGQLNAPGGPHVAQATPLDLNTVVRQMAASLQRLLGPFISLETAIDSPSVWVAADRSQIEQVALGLIINAREALPLGGTVCLSTRRKVLDRAREYRAGRLTAGDWGTLEVRDNGNAIDERAVEYLLRPSPRRLPFDSSLSLATISTLVRDAGGQVVLDVAPGGGTVLAACFPTTRAPRSRQPATGAASAVLIVDDDEWTRMSAARILRHAGYGVLEAEHAEAALELLADIAGSCVRLMLMDASLMSGSQRLPTDRIRWEHPDVEIVLTVLARAAHPGPDGSLVLEKPFRSDDLLKAVRERLPAST